MAEISGGNFLTVEAGNEIADAMRATIPLPASTSPKTESGTGVIGSDQMRYALEDHRHPRVTSSTPVTLDANGQGSVTFSRSFTSEPMPAFARMPGGTAGPALFEVTSWVQDGSGNYTGATIAGYRLTGPRALATVTVVGVSVVAGGQAPITTYGPADGAKVSVIMLPNSSV